MKRLFAEIILNKEDLKESNCCRLKLEYYKISRKERSRSKAKLYGIEVVKKEYENSKRVKEKRKIQGLTNDEKRINNLLHILERNKVTPISVDEIIEEVL